VPRLSENISVISDFQYSVNIGADLFSDEKIINYIPTTSAIEIIEDVMLSLNDNATDRARIFTGAYGKGKSHLALVLISLLSRKEEPLFCNLLEKIQEYNAELYDLVTEYINSNRRLLPVVIQGSGLGIRQSLMSELKKSLTNLGLEHLMPDTYFKAAVATIENWEKEYTKTYEAFAQAIDGSISDYIAELFQYNVDYYNNFTKIYKELSAGAEFNPASAMTVTELYTDVVQKIKAEGYNGIFVVYDEFSKYLQGNSRKDTGDDFKALQDFAELCTRSKDKQLHIMLISHQSIINYFDKDISKTKIDEWKAVSNRFKTIELNNNSSQMYQIISHVIDHNPTWFADFSERNKSLFEQTVDKWSKHRAFAELTDNEKENLVYAGYPLEPITTYLLPKISELIAQNERTIFTFLSASGQKNSLTYFLKHKDDADFPVVTPDYIFDYFEPLFKAEGYNKPIHKIWKTAFSALNKLDDSSFVERQMVKTVALIYIHNQFEILAPTTDFLISVYNGSVYDMNVVVKAIENLIDKKIFAKPNSSNYLRITEHTDINIDELITNTVAKIEPITDIKTILNSFSGDIVLYPNAYNDNNEIVRFFNFEFITIPEMQDVEDWEVKISGISGDGIAYAIISNTENAEEIRALIEAIRNERIVFITLAESADIYEDAIKYEAVKQIIESSQDKLLVEELAYTFDDLYGKLNSYVEMFLRPELSKAHYYNAGVCQIVRRRSALSRMLSYICERVFTDCPVINNETISKNIISTQAMNSRTKVVDGLLRNEILPDLGLTGTGQDVSFMRSTVKSTQILTTDNNKAALNITELPDNNLTNMLLAIKNFILRSSADREPLCFRELYNLLTLPQYHIGIKKGVIPIYLACVLHFYKKYAVITSRKREVEITAKLLEAINENPDGYYIYLEQWDNEKENYIKELESLFSKHTNVAEKEYNDFEYIVKSMQRWFLQLPKYTKEIEHSYAGNGEFAEIDANTLKLKSALKVPEINAREFLFNKLFWIYGTKSFNSVLKSLAVSKTLLDETKYKLTELLEAELIIVFNGKPKASLSSVILDWCDSLKEDVFTHLFNGSESTLLATFKTITPDSKKFIENVARITIGLRIDDWDQTAISSFLSSIKEFKETIEAYNNDISRNSGTLKGSYKITVIAEDGTESFKTFDKTEYNEKTKLFYNDVEAMLAEYGEAVSNNEKRQALIDIIEKRLG